MGFLNLFVCMVLLFLTACQRDGLAPVVELNWHGSNIHAKQHIVKSGDTLYAIAFRYDTDYRQLALINGLRSPYALRIGQVIYLQARQAAQRAQPIRPRLKRMMTPTRSSSDWFWPAQGRIVTYFAPLQGKKGIDIEGRSGGKIYAARNGLVAYAGSGLAGYGNLIIIKHSNQLLTAYANSARNLVKEGQSVKLGQVIAYMGVVDRRFWGLHFEIRQAGQPVNPLNYLHPK